MIDVIISNIDTGKLDAANSDRTIGKAGLAINVISEAMVKSSVKMFGDRFYCFNGQIYEPVNKMEGVIMGLLCRIDPSGQLSGRHASITSGVLKSISMNELNVDNSLICFRNCVLDMETEKKMNFSREHHVVSRLDYDYDPSAKPDLWLRFLHDVLPDEESINLLQEFLGAIFVDRRKAKIETMLFLLGKGANGKSVVFDTVTGVLGSRNVSNYEISDLTNSIDKKKNVVDINGKLLNYCSEVSSKSFASSSFKALVSGEPQQGRPVYGMPVKVENIPLMMANANTMPSYQDMSDGVYRRIVILPFERVIPEAKQDKELSSKMRMEYPAIMNWILDGRRNIARRGYKLTISSSARAAMDTYRGENNSVYEFIEASGLVPVGEGEPERVGARDLYAMYKEFCDSSGLEAEKETGFGRTLSNIGFAKVRTAKGNMYNIFTKQ